MSSQTFPCNRYSDVIKLSSCWWRSQKKREFAPLSTTWTVSRILLVTSFHVFYIPLSSDLKHLQVISVNRLSMSRRQNFSSLFSLLRFASLHCFNWRGCFWMFSVEQGDVQSAFRSTFFGVLGTSQTMYIQNLTQNMHDTTITFALNELRSTLSQANPIDLLE